MKSINALLLLSLSLLISPASSFCQEKDKEYAPSLELKVDNDFFNISLKGTDRYYTNGFFIGVKSYVKNKNIFDRLMVAEDSPYRIREIMLSHQIYTPQHIGNPELQVGDYPYAALLAVNYSNLTLKSDYALCSQLTVGVQGPIAQGERVQMYLHRKIFKSNVPQGWKYQLPNDIALRYTVRLEKRVWNVGKFDLRGNAEVNIGTLNNNLKVGATLCIGSVNSFFSVDDHLFLKKGRTGRKGVTFSVTPYIMMVQGNSLLEGGPLKSAGGAWGTYNAKYYHIDRSQLEKFVYGYSWTFRYSGKSMGISYSQNFYSPEIKGLDGHLYGSFSFDVRL